MSEPVYLSFSEIESFLRCRYKWDLSSANRQSIRHKTTPKLYLSLGSAVHKGLEEGYRGNNPIKGVQDYMASELEAKTKEYVERTGTQPWPVEFKEMNETFDFARDLVRQYFNRYDQDNPLEEEGLKYLGIEVPFKINISEGVWGKVSDPWPVYFCGTLDGIAVDEFGQIWIVENKTYTAKPSPEDIQWHYQAQGYAVALEWLTGMSVAGVLYNGIAKKLMTEPRVLKNGLLSTDKRQNTTLSRYVEAIRSNGENVDDPRFADILSHLRGIDNQGDTRFFYREKAFFTTEQLDAWRSDFFKIVKEMLDSPRIYRTIPYNGCGDCWYRDLCHTQSSGGGVEFLLEKRYTQGSSYGTIEEVRGKEPVQISSVEELKEYLSND